MKTPMHRLREIILKQRDYNLKNFQKYPSNSETYEARLFLCDDILDGIDSYFLDWEKEIIMYSFQKGEDHAVALMRSDKIKYKSSEDYYNQFFNTKEQ